MADGGEGAGEEGEDAKGCGGEVGEGLAEDGHCVAGKRLRVNPGNNEDDRDEDRLVG